MSLPFSYGGIAYTELVAGSGRVSVGLNATAQRRFKCAWQDRLYLALALRGWSSTTPRISGTVAVAWAPTRPAAHPCGLGYYCMDVAISPMGRALAEDTWEYAVLDIVYKPLTFTDANSTDMFDEEGDLSGEVVDLGNANWTYGDSYSSANPACLRPLAKLVPLINYQVSMYHVSALPLSSARALMGKLNDATWRGAEAGKVMYAGMTFKRKMIAAFGLVYYYDWQLTHKFIVGNRDLRTEWNPTTGAFAKVVNSLGVYKFETGDFTALRIPATPAWVV